MPKGGKPKTPEQKAAACAASKRYREKHPETAKAYAAVYNKTPAAKAAVQRWAEENRETDQAKRKARIRKRLASDPTLAPTWNARQRAWYAQNAPRLNEEQRAKFHSSPDFRLAHNLRVRLREAIHAFRTKKWVSAIDVGCSIAELVTHIEQRWEPGMDWSTYGNKAGQWSIDHIRPLSSFDLTHFEQQKAACHYTNLQPLWHVANLRKGAAYAAE